MINAPLKYRQGWAKVNNSPVHFDVEGRLDASCGSEFSQDQVSQIEQLWKDRNPDQGDEDDSFGFGANKAAERKPRTREEMGLGGRLGKVAADVFPNDIHAQEALAGIASDIHASRQADAIQFWSARNELIDNFVSRTKWENVGTAENPEWEGKEDNRKRGAFVSSLRAMHERGAKGGDVTGIKGFDEMVEMAQRDYPILLQSTHGESGGGDEDSLVENLLKRQEDVYPPAVHSDEIITEALAEMDRQESQTSDWEPPEDLDSIPFRKRGPKWLYSKFSRLRQFKYALQRRLFDTAPEGPKGNFSATPGVKRQPSLFNQDELQAAGEEGFQGPAGPQAGEMRVNQAGNVLVLRSGRWHRVDFAPEPIEGVRRKQTAGQKGLFDAAPPLRADSKPTKPEAKQAAPQSLEADTPITVTDESFDGEQLFYVGKGDEPDTHEVRNGNGEYYTFHTAEIRELAGGERLDGQPGAVSGTEIDNRNDAGGRVSAEASDSSQREQGQSVHDIPPTDNPSMASGEKEAAGDSGEGAGESSEGELGGDGDWNPAQAVKISADSIEQLRNQDVYRVLDSAPTEHLQGMADYITENRSDLAEEVKDALADIRDERGDAVDSDSEPEGAVVQTADGPIKVAKDGSFLRQAKAGGEVSPVNGEFYKGGRWMPIHGLSQKQDSTPKGKGGGDKPTGSEEGKGRQREPRREMSPEDIAAKQEAMEREAKWTAARDGWAGKILPMGERPHTLKASIPGIKRFEAVAQELGADKVKRLADHLESEVVKFEREKLANNPNELKLHDGSGESLTVDDAIQNYRDTIRGWAEVSEAYHTKKHLRDFPDSPRAQQLIGEFIEQRGTDGIFELNQKIETLANAPNNVYDTTIGGVSKEMSDLVAKIDKESARLDKLHSSYSPGSSRARTTTHNANAGKSARLRDEYKAALRKMAREQLEAGGEIPQSVRDALGSSIDYDDKGNYSPIGPTDESPASGSVEEPDANDGNGEGSGVSPAGNAPTAEETATPAETPAVASQTEESETSAFTEGAARLNLLINDEGKQKILAAPTSTLGHMAETFHKKAPQHFKDRAAARQAILDFRAANGVTETERDKSRIAMALNSTTPTLDEIEHALKHVRQTGGTYRTIDPDTGEYHQFAYHDNKNQAVNYFIAQERRKFAEQNGLGTSYGREGYKRPRGNYRSWLKSHGTSENELLGIDKTAEKKAIEAKIANASMNLEGANGFIEKLRTGEVTADELRQGYQQFRENRGTILEELKKLPKKALARYSPFHANENKNKLAEMALGRIRDSFNISEKAGSWMMGTDHWEKVQSDIANLTDDHIASNAASVKAAREGHAKELAERHAAAKKAFENPETIDEFRAFVRMRGENELTPEHRTTYDRLITDANREKRREERLKKAEVKAVDVGGLGFSKSEVPHSKTGEIQHVVSASQRTDKDTYREMNSAAKRLGGYWSRWNKGFTFKTDEQAQNFMRAMGGESISGEERLGEREAAKADSRKNRLHSVADSIEERANAVLSADRKVNTARRASMAESTEGAARREIAKAHTMRNIAEAIDRGEAEYLTGVGAGTHIDTLDQELSRGRSEYARQEHKKNPELNYRDRENMWSEPYGDKHIAHVQYPYPSIHKDTVREIMQDAVDKPGMKMIANRYLKALKDIPEDQWQVKFDTADKLNDLKKIRERANLGYGTKQSIDSAMENYNRLQKMDIHNGAELRTALREYLPLRGKQGSVDPVQKAERALIGRKIEGFFPTPSPVIDQMLDYADIRDGHAVLEPSAGKGDIVDAVKARHPESSITGLEYNRELKPVLHAKGHEIEFGDFMQHSGQYDRIVMNPPFERGQDREHVQHAFNQLKSGGRVVAIMSAGPFQRSHKADEEFRQWLDSVGGEVHDLPEGSFAGNDAFRQTGVNTKLVVIDKE